MSIVELGSLAAAIVAVMTLTTKIVSLITSIQNLINRLDTMQKEIEASKDGLKFLNDRMNGYEGRVKSLEINQTILKNQLKEDASYATAQ